MPRKDDLQVIRELRGELPTAKIIVMTSYELEVLSSAAQLDVSYIFIKSFRMENFLQAVSKTLES
tara:strand:- start:877 stop:1071 length:195 start_codon:yes stop_codon:yes gene_type:complete